jgi:MFS transporter, PHS family, inorganic phosphate transporter
MQPVGELVAAVVATAVSAGVGPDTQQETRRVDRTWRIVVGVGALPALIALIGRLTIPESPRFDLDVLNEIDAAYKAVRKYDKDQDVALTLSIASMIAPPEPDDVSLDSLSDRSIPQRAPPQFAMYRGLKQYFFDEGNWRFLAVVSLCWFLLDCAIHGLGLYTPTIMSNIWADDLNEGRPLEALKIFSWHSMVIVSVGSVVGGLLSIRLVDYVRRSSALFWTFVALAVLFGALGSTLLQYPASSAKSVALVLYALCNFVFNIGR